MLKIFKYPSAYANSRYLFDYLSYIPYHQLSFLQAMPACLRPNHRPAVYAVPKNLSTNNTYKPMAAIYLAKDKTRIQDKNIKVFFYDFRLTNLIR